MRTPASPVAPSASGSWRALVACSGRPAWSCQGSESWTIGMPGGVADPCLGNVLPDQHHEEDGDRHWYEDPVPDISVQDQVAGDHGRPWCCWKWAQDLLRLGEQALGCAKRSALLTKWPDQASGRGLSEASLGYTKGRPGPFVRCSAGVGAQGVVSQRPSQMQAFGGRGELGPAAQRLRQ